MADYILKEFPVQKKLETPAVLKQTVKASRALTELKGISKTIPAEIILINTIPLLEAKDNSEVENISTKCKRYRRLGGLGALYAARC